MALRVLHIGKFFPPVRGGMESFLSELVQAQQALGLQVRVLVHGTPQPDDPAWLTRVPVQATLAYAPIALGFRRQLVRQVLDWQPDVLHLHMPNLAVFWALSSSAARRIPWVVHWHSDVVVSPRSPRALRLAYAAYRPLEQAVLEQADRIIATSEPYLQASEPLRRWRYKCSPIPLGIDPRIPAVPAGGLPLPWQGPALRVLSIGRLAHYKGFETLIDAVAATPGVQLAIAGDGEAMPSLRRLVQRLQPAQAEPRIHLLGEVSDAHKHALLASCDVFCLASRERTEAFGVVLLEAMAHAKPCVVADLPGSGMPWVVRAAGAGLSHVPVDSVAAWQQVLAQLCSQRHILPEWGQRGRSGLQACFSIDTCAQAVAGQYARPALPRVAAPAGNPAHPLMHTPARDDVLIVIPARNEADTIHTVVQQVRSAGWQHVLVIDDQSTDATGALARAAGATVARPVLPCGAWGAMQLGLRHALARGYQAVITMDADGQHEVDELPALLGAAAQADLVIGAYPHRASVLRRVAWRWFRLLSGLDLRDLTSGFRYYNRRAVEVLAGPRATLLDYQDLGVILMLRDAGLRIAEVPVRMRQRASGQSRIFDSWRTVLRYMAATTLLCVTRRKAYSRAHSSTAGLSH